MGCNENGISWTWNLYRNNVVIKMDHDTTTKVAGMIAAGAATSRVFAYVSGASGVGAVPAVVAGAGGILLAYYAGDMLLHDDGCGIKLKYHIYKGSRPRSTTSTDSRTTPMFGMSPAQLWANYAVLSALVAAYLFYVGMTSMDPPTWLWIFLAFEGISAIYAGAQAVRQRDT